ncbi:MAG: hypothetical protein K6A05_04880 [Lachnospiraceae bacterium]|nr:hypothetical protein [Lachnospiraceae bacterium]
MRTCKGCTKRTLGCHDTCPSYLAEVMASEAKKEQKRKAKFAYSALTDYEINGRRKSVREHGRKK